MHRRLALLAVLSTAATALVAVVPTASAVVPLRTLVVSGTATEMYPVFAAGTTRYAVTTDATTGGSLTVDATTSDPAGHVWVDGVPAAGATQVTGLAAGDEVSVIVEDAAGRTPYSLFYLPAGFPKISTTTLTTGAAPGLVGLTLNTFTGSQPAFDAIIDRNGVPVYAVAASQQDLDLKQQPTGEITVSRPTTAPGRTGTDLVSLDDDLAEGTRRHVAGPLTDTDGHDAERLADGSTVLIGYERDLAHGRTDATIQKLDADGDVTFSWSSAALLAETTASTAVQNAQGIPGDYAHVNSVQTVGDDDVLVSFRHLSAVLRIATVAHDGYQPGDVVWKLGGRDSSFDLVDDPFGGPCAQHTASMLENGHVLLFDNGTSGLCVDPADPTGPSVARGRTRVAEYALDTTAHTATLVWSYAPEGKYALFAGSARRTANGDTLIGWAADRNALATEVDHDGNTVWEATTPAGPTRYMTYRAELIQHDDQTLPTVTTTGPADHATLVVGDVVGAGARCSDRGGANLASCTSTGLTGGRLVTSSSGTRSWTTTAVDGSGNTRTVTRSYTVRPPVARSDSWIRTAGSATWKGNDLRPSATHQTVLQRGRIGRPATSYLLAQNDGERADVLVLQGMAGTRGFAVRYYAGGRNVTAAMLAGTFRTARLAPGRSQQVRVVVTPRRARGAGPARTFLLSSWPLGERSDFDRVGVRVTVRR